MGKDTKQLYDLVKTLAVQMLLHLEQVNEDICRAIPDDGLGRHEANELGERVRAVKQAVADLATFAESKLQ